MFPSGPGVFQLNPENRKNKTPFSADRTHGYRIRWFDSYVWKNMQLFW